MESLVTEIADGIRFVLNPVGIGVGVGAGFALMSGAAGNAILKAQDLFTPRSMLADGKEG
jgi:hypothetical protein